MVFELRIRAAKFFLEKNNKINKGRIIYLHPFAHSKGRSGFEAPETFACVCVCMFFLCICYSMSV